MDINMWILFADVPEPFQIPIQRQFRMVPALHQDLNPARRGKFVEFFVELFPAQHVMVGVFFRPVERAKLAVDVADVRVIDVAIDDVSHDFAAAIAVAGGFRLVSPRGGKLPELRQGKPVKLQRFRRRDPLPREHFLGERFFRQGDHADILPDACRFCTHMISGDGRT